MKRAWLALNRNGGRDLIADTLVYILAKGVPGVLGLASVVVFLRLVGAEAYGLYALLSAIISVWVTFSAGWFYQGILRFGDAWSTTRPVFHRTIITGTWLVCGIFCVCCTIHQILAGKTQSIGLIACTLILGTLIVAQTILLSVLQTLLQPRRILLTELIRSVGCFTCAVSLVYAIPDGAVGLLAGTAVGYALSFLGARPWSAWFQASMVGSLHKPAVISHLKQAWHYGWPLSLWFAVQLLIPLIDRTMISNQWGLEATGKFSGLSDILTRCFSLTIFPVTQAVYPRLARLNNDGQFLAARSLLRRAGLLLLVAGAIILPIIYYLRHFIVKFALSSFDESFTPLVLPLATGGFIWQAALLVHKPLELSNRTPTMLIAIVGAVILKGTVNYLAIPVMGPMGAAWATLAAGIGYCLLCVILIRPRNAVIE